MTTADRLRDAEGWPKGVFVAAAPGGMRIYANPPGGGSYPEADRRFIVTLANHADDIVRWLRVLEKVRGLPEKWRGMDPIDGPMYAAFLEAVTGERTALPPREPEGVDWRAWFRPPTDTWLLARMVREASQTCVDVGSDAADARDYLVKFAAMRYVELVEDALDDLDAALESEETP